jgi:phosphopantothenoylcysteine synthetase/decarboxylase
MVPAMHYTILDNAAVQKNVQTLKERHVQFVGPVKGALADQSTAEGRMADVEEIIAAVKKILAKKS